MIAAPSLAAALAVANPKPEVPPIRTMRCPFKVWFSLHVIGRKASSPGTHLDNDSGGLNKRRPIFQILSSSTGKLFNAAKLAV
jgi:hypothetical protein